MAHFLGQDMILYRFRVFSSPENNGTFTYDNDVYSHEVTEEQIEPFRQSLEDGRICTVATSSPDDSQEVLVVMSLDKKALASFYHGFHFCLNAARNWNSYFSMQGINKEHEKISSQGN